MQKIFNKFSILIAISLAAALSPAALQAQAFSFSVGSGHHGHHGHHYHGHHHGGCWGPSWCGPAFGFAYAPVPVYRERVVYVEPPRTTTVIVPQASTNVTSVPLANSLPPDNSTDGRIVIRNASGARLPVAFLVDGQDVELPDGQSRVFTGTRHTVQYDRGGRFGNSQQALANGNYDFRITPSGWDLVRQPDPPAASTAVRANSLPSQR